MSVSLHKNKSKKKLNAANILWQSHRCPFGRFGATNNTYHYDENWILYSNEWKQKIVIISFQLDSGCFLSFHGKFMERNCFISTRPSAGCILKYYYHKLICIFTAAIAAAAAAMPRHHVMSHCISHRESAINIIFFLFRFICFCVCNELHDMNYCHRTTQPDDKCE